MDTLISIVGVLSIIWFYRWRRRHLLDQKTKYELFELRDKLRMLDINGQIKEDSWTFSYLDSTICKTIDNLGSVNIYSTLALNLIHRNEKILKEFTNDLNDQLSKSKVESDILKKYHTILVNYVYKKHTTLKAVFSIFIFIKLVSALKLRTESDIRKFSIFPETSASPRFIPSIN